MLKVLYLQPDAGKFRAFKYLVRDLFKESRGMALVDQVGSARELWMALDRETYEVVVADHAMVETRSVGEPPLANRLLSRDASLSLVVTEAPELVTLDHTYLGWVEKRRLSYLSGGALTPDRVRDAFQQVFGREKHVLVIEDEPDDYELIRAQLMMEGAQRYQTTWVTSVQEASELVGQDRDRFDAFIVDYRLPKEDGMTLVRRLLDLGIRKPILLLTGASELRIDLDSARLINHGQMKFLNKHRLDAMQIGSALLQ